MSELRLPTFEDDHFRLSNAERIHRQHPDTFWLPPARERRALERGTDVKVIFELQDPVTGEELGGERMWVAVTERVGDRYLGLLRNQPFAYAPDDEAAYLRWGAEVAFGPEHVIDINDEDRVDEGTLSGFTRRWPR